MIKMIFLNSPAGNLPRARAFYGLVAPMTLCSAPAANKMGGSK